MKKWIKIILIILAVLIVLNYVGEKEEENCNLTFHTNTYNDGCASACSSKCFNEGLPSSNAGFFEPYLSVEDMTDTKLYKRCECNCGGCRK